MSPVVNAKKEEKSGEEAEEEEKNNGHVNINEKSKSKNRKRKEESAYGNYKNYYGYRIDKGMDEDPRLQVLKREWFHGKECLDIGCNSGIITISIAKKFGCRRILGIDIDGELIQHARWNLRRIVREDSKGNLNVKPSKLNDKERVNDLEHGPTVPSVGNAKVGSCPEESELPRIVSFKVDNFVESWGPPEERFDTILCLSVTKWFHLNWGDDGLITALSKIWKILRPGGILVLEPQPWRSYESKHLVSERAATNYRAIKFHPECFQEILLDKIGFRKVEDITSGLAGSKTGFQRPILAFHK
ncbi:hypothetical protein K2173_016200 [Erythroxylum novogranatense]|uniref:RNA methyltransferase n=1 Tax=Erythroxylum novogranatense TaxID=1862640 RepID=A0AAV8SG71_9ROSI|nr:hypothetical protein K2173_016200 [Erythroxylum novogranatense]